MESAAQYDPNDYSFISATIADNPIYAGDLEYQRTLDGLPSHLRRAFLQGDWNVLSGQYFDVLDCTRHTMRPEEVPMETWWPRWISIDWGFEHPSAVLWHAAAPDGVVVTYREFVQNHLSPRMLATAIAERSRGERIGSIYLSPDAFAQRTAEDTIADQLGQGLAAEHLPRPDPADDERVGGWMLMYELLRTDKWIITKNCSKLIESLPILTRNEANIEDIRKTDGDDVADSARYGIKSRLDPRRTSLSGLDANIAARAERISTEDPTSRAIWLRKIEADSRKPGGPGRKHFGVSAPRRWKI
jgi:hypothetical protein